MMIVTIVTLSTMQVSAGGKKGSPKNLEISSPTSVRHVTVPNTSPKEIANFFSTQQQNPSAPPLYPSLNPQPTVSIGGIVQQEEKRKEEDTQRLEKYFNYISDMHAKWPKDDKGNLIDGKVLALDDDVEALRSSLKTAHIILGLQGVAMLTYTYILWNEITKYGQSFLTYVSGHASSHQEDTASKSQKK